MADSTTPGDIIDFWIGDAAIDPAVAKERSKLWYRADESTDRDIRKRFGATIARAAAGDLAGWEETAEGALALVILLDQFSRNCYRGTAAAFANDAHALKIAKRALEAGHDRSLSAAGRAFLYHPFQHSESVTEQNRNVKLVATLVETVSPEWTEFATSFANSAKEHREIVARFGRFPHRNVALNRASSATERDYLRQSARYGQ